MTGGDLCTCGHLDECHKHNHLLGTLENCKYCKCKAFEWGGTYDIETDAELDTFGFNWTPDADNDEDDLESYA